MPCYHFKIRNGKFESKDLGVYTLGSDIAALNFANGVIRDVMHTRPEMYTGWTLNFMEGTRMVGCLPFGAP
jgi:hypothetical protein